MSPRSTYGDYAREVKMRRPGKSNKIRYREKKRMQEQKKRKGRIKKLITIKQKLREMEYDSTFWWRDVNNN